MKRATPGSATRPGADRSCNDPARYCTGVAHRGAASRPQLPGTRPRPGPAARAPEEAPVTPAGRGRAPEQRVSGEVLAPVEEGLADPAARIRTARRRPRERGCPSPRPPPPPPPAACAECVPRRRPPGAPEAGRREPGRPWCAGTGGGTAGWDGAGGVPEGGSRRLPCAGRRVVDVPWSAPWRPAVLVNASSPYRWCGWAGDPGDRCRWRDRRVRRGSWCPGAAGCPVTDDVPAPRRGPASASCVPMRGGSVPRSGGARCGTDGRWGAGGDVPPPA